MKAFLFVSALLALSSCAHVDLQAKYPFSVVLLDDGEEYYGLHWNFTRSTESIYFAVNVSTTGWVGFGLSPNGAMTGSDLIIGWVDGENSYFHDRYAEGTFLPPIDQSQDWFLVNSEEENGFTVLEFSRNFTTCDDRDRDITGSTDRVVWSFRGQDPTGPTGADALQHDRRGTASVNLLGGLPTGNREFSEDEPTLDILVNSVEIPDASTTYWCRSIALPEELANQTHYINRFSPILTSHPRQYVHHILIYLCTNPLTPEEVDVSVPCNELPSNANECRGQLLIGAWAVGGEDFTYPEGISYPVGGSGQEHFAVLEMHYDNPTNDQGVVDNSGLSFFYTTEQPEQEAGIISLGSAVTPSMVIPPRADNFTITGVCSMECTNEFIPEEGVRIFASILHTHLIGREVTIQHFRRNPDCGVLEELEPIDQNLNYDFNFQQLVYLPREHIVLPGDILVVNCVYDSSRNTELTLGGESTLEEMCLSFPVYYPRSPNGKSLVNCISLPTASSFSGFVNYLQQDGRYSDVAQELMSASDNGARIEALNSLDWGSDRNLAIAAQDSVLHGSVLGYCSTEDGSKFRAATTTPVAECSYQAADQCTGFEPLSCCERLSAGAPSQMQINLSASIFMILMSIITFY